MSVDKIIPILVYNDIAKAQDYLVDVFGFRRGRLDRLSDGSVVHAEVHQGDDVIWMHRVTNEHGMVAAPEGGTHSGLVVHVADVDAHYAKAKAAGARIDREPEDQPYGQREYGARDLEGHRWWFATPLSR